MIGFGGNSMGGTTITDGDGMVGFTLRAGRYFTAYVVKGQNMASLGESFGTDREAVGAIMRRRHALSRAEI
jgi:hypothetical protein